jgi:hypothetical protein
MGPAFDLVLDVLSILAVLLAILALTPREWKQRLGAWASVVHVWTPRVLAVVLLITVPAWLYREATEPFPDCGYPTSPGGILSGAADLTRLNELIAQQARDGRRHEVRLLVATGGSTFGAMNNAIEQQFQTAEQTGSRFDVRVLLLSPEADGTAFANPAWPDEAARGIAFLQGMQDRYQRMGDDVVSVDWRTYSEPPILRAVAFDRDEMFLGYFQWFRDGAAPPRLENQSCPYLNIRAGQTAWDHLFPMYCTWFETQWSGAEADYQRC